MTRFSLPTKLWLTLAIALTTLVYWPGLSGSWLFDDHPNIVDNPAVQPHSANLSSLVNAALSSPASEFKRPLASLSFAVNYLLAGLDPFWMKLTNLVIHLLNGLLIFVLSRNLLKLVKPHESSKRIGSISVLITAGWLLLPINLTAVLYVVQRMESLANLFVLAGLIGYIFGRRQMLSETLNSTHRFGSWKGITLCTISVTLPTAIGVLAKETAVMLPLYAFLTEWIVFGFRIPSNTYPAKDVSSRRDWRLLVLFFAVLALPAIVGLTWLTPQLLTHEAWASRDFTLYTRLLSEARIVVAYIVWTILPNPHDLSFYHDNFKISTGFLSPPTTLASIVCLTALIYLAIRVRRQLPLVSLGVTFFLGCHLLTATVLPLELVYEHRNYFASFGILLALIPLLLPARPPQAAPYHFVLARHFLLGGLILLWCGETAITAKVWGNPLELAQDLPMRAPDSPRAQYELGRTYILYSQYNPNSPFTRLAYEPLEKAAAIPGSSILPEQALIFMNSRMGLPIKDAWWNSLIAKLKAHKPTVQDESSLAALTACDRDQFCKLPNDKLEQAYFAALSHPNPNARLLAMYGDFAWNVMGDHELGLRLAKQTVQLAPNEPAYRITLIRMLSALHHRSEMENQIRALERLNIGGRLDSDVAALQRLPSSQ